MQNSFRKGNKWEKRQGEGNEMFGWTQSEMLLYGGITIMAAAGVLTVVCIVVFTLTGRKLKKELEQEYGKPQQ